MSRRRKAQTREVLPDPVHNSVVLSKFTNAIMLDGKKSISEKIVYGAFDIVSKKTEKDPLAFFHEALDKVKPNLEVRSRRVGGATYQVPMEVRPRRAQALANGGSNCHRNDFRPRPLMVKFHFNRGGERK